jgi:hypothetical protein
MQLSKITYVKWFIVVILSSKLLLLPIVTSEKLKDIHMKNVKKRGTLMNDINTGDRFYKDNFAAQREQREVEKYGKRLPIPELAAHAHVYLKHSIELVYGNYDRPINESV